jgi:hypothetical protein
MEAEIRHLCNVMINVINERDFDYQSTEAHVFRTRHISPDFHAKIDANPWALSFEEQTEFWRQLTVDCPSVYFVLEGLDCIIHNRHRTADVLMRATMMRGDVRLLTACLTQWKFSKGRWQWYCHSGIRGISCESSKAG